MLTEVVIEDFQSHEKTVVALAAGYNCFIGPTDTGKSSCLRAIRWALCNDLAGTKFIRNSGTTAVVQLTLASGARITRFKSRKTANGYKVELPGQELKLYDKIGDALPLEVMAECRVAPILIDGGWQLFPQFQGQFDPPFLLSETAPRRAKMLHRLSYSHIVDEALRLVRQDALASSRQVTELTTRQTEIETQLTSLFGNLEVRLAAAEQVQKLLDQKTQLEERLRWAQSLVTTEKAAQVRVQRATEKVAKLQGFEPATLEATLSSLQQVSIILPAFRTVRARAESAATLLQCLPGDESFKAWETGLESWTQWSGVFAQYRQAQLAAAAGERGLAAFEPAVAATLKELQALGACPTCGKPLSAEELASVTAGVV